MSEPTTFYTKLAFDQPLHWRFLAALSNGDADDGWVEVSVVGGYKDSRGDACKNSVHLLNALQNDVRVMELKHFCVGRFNTTTLPRGCRSSLSTETTAIIRGVAVDLLPSSPVGIFPAVFEWGNYDDFKVQIKDKFRLKTGRDPLDAEDLNKTAASTFKPKCLRNKANHDYLLRESGANNVLEHHIIHPD